MTRERTLKVLEMFLDKQCSIERTLNHMDTTDVEIWDAVYTATKALSAEPCEDAISRHAVLETIDSRIEQIKKEADAINESYSHLSFAEGVHDGYCRLKCDLWILPSVTPRPKMGRWIPISERLPEPFSFVNCTCHSLIDDREDWVVETIYLPQPPNSPYSDWGNIPMLNWGECEVIAWMYRDIPEPYKAESEDKESE